MTALAGGEIVGRVGVEREEHARALLAGAADALRDGRHDGPGLGRAERAGDKVGLHIDDDEQIGHGGCPPCV